jgi:L-seryl-tRNA(Ser) seleniumtransferase
VIEDFGSGNLISLAPFGLPKEPAASASLATGIDLCIFSGDKLLGGPQAGILIGESSRVEACRRNPMSRALRVDKLSTPLRPRFPPTSRESVREIPVLQYWPPARDQPGSRLASASKSQHSPLKSASAFVGGGAARYRIPT